MTVDINLINQLNQRAKQSNQNRTRLLGQKEMSQKQFEQGIQAYKQKYGVDLTQVSIEEEYQREVERINAEAQALQQQLQDIESGAYKLKNADGTTKATPMPSASAQAQPQVQAQPAAESAAESAAQAQPSNPVVQGAAPQAQTATPGDTATPSWAQPAPQAQPQEQAQPQAAQPNPAQSQEDLPPWAVPNPDVNLFGGNQAQQAQAAPAQASAQPVEGQQDPSEQPFTPPGWGATSTKADPEIEKTFNSMFSNPAGGNGTTFGG